MRGIIFGIIAASLSFPEAPRAQEVQPSVTCKNVYSGAVRCEQDLPGYSKDTLALDAVTAWINGRQEKQRREALEAQKRAALAADIAETERKIDVRVACEQARNFALLAAKTPEEQASAYSNYAACVK